MILTKINSSGMQFRRNIATEVLAAGITAAGAIGSAGASAAGQASLNEKTRQFNKEEAEKQRQWSEALYNKQNAWNYEMWQKENEYNSPVAQFQRMRDAGLNPMYYGLDGTRAGDLTAAQPLSYERAKADNQPNPISEGIRTGLDVYNATVAGRNAAKDIQLKNAQIDKLSEETQGIKLDNEWKDKTLDARTQSVELSNNLTKSQIQDIDKDIEKKGEEIAKLISETDNEREKKGLIIAQKILVDAQAKEIVALLPYKQLLIEAQTDGQRASAAASYASAAINQGLIKAGYIERTIDDLAASIKQKNAAAGSAEAQKAINEWKMSVRNGTTFNPDNYSDGVSKVVCEIANGFFGIISTASEAVGGGLSGFFK